MIYVLTPEQMRAADAAAIATTGDDALMRNAGMQVADLIRTIAPAGARVVAFAGPGNNGGDAFSALAELGPEWDAIVHAAPVSNPSPARAAAEKRAREAGVAIRHLPATQREAETALEGAIAVDGLFGTGARLPLAEPYRVAARALDAREHPVIAIDIPSGIDALTGAVGDDVVRATSTITLGAAKPGLLLDPAREYVGELWYARIGIDDELMAAQGPTYAALDDDAFEAMLPRRGAGVDKRGAGAPLVIAGSAQFPGAAILCARASARAGAGYVTVATPAAAAPALRAHLIEQVVVEIGDASSADEVIDALLDISRHNGSVAIGPGLGLDERTGRIVCGFLARCDLPVVADASALFHLSKNLDVLHGKRAVVTPHAGEFARLSGKGTIATGARVDRVREFVLRTGITTLLKGRDTLIDDGAIVNINASGTNALATAGSGDVLSGIVATLLSQGLAPVDAARTGAYWHGLAGQLAARRKRVGVIAHDLIDALADCLPSADQPARAPYKLNAREGIWRLY